MPPLSMSEEERQITICKKGAGSFFETVSAGGRATAVTSSLRGSHHVGSVYGRRPTTNAPHPASRQT